MCLLLLPFHKFVPFEATIHAVLCLLPIPLRSIVGVGLVVGGRVPCDSSPWACSPTSLIDPLGVYPFGFNRSGKPFDSLVVDHLSTSLGTFFFVTSLSN